MVANISDRDDDYAKDCGGGKKLLNIHSGLKKGIGEMAGVFFLTHVVMMMKFVK